MSFRVVFSGYADGDCSGWADVEIGPDVQDGDLATTAKAIAWQMPLKIFVPTYDDPRVRKLADLLDERYAMGPDEYRVFERGHEEVSAVYRAMVLSP